jgi:hypothetical protein
MLYKSIKILFANLNPYGRESVAIDLLGPNLAPKTHRRRFAKFQIIRKFHALRAPRQAPQGELVSTNQFSVPPAKPTEKWPASS